MLRPKSWLAALALCGLLAGCASDTKEVEAWVAEVKARPACSIGAIQASS